VTELQQRQELSQEAWDGWLQHPVTKALRRTLLYWQRQKQEQWASGAFTDQQHFGTAILNAKAIGNCEAWNQVIELDFDKLIGEIEDVEYDRAQTLGKGGSS